MLNGGWATEKSLNLFPFFLYYKQDAISNKFTNLYPCVWFFIFWDNFLDRGMRMNGSTIKHINAWIAQFFFPRYTVTWRFSSKIFHWVLTNIKIQNNWGGGGGELFYKKLQTFVISSDRINELGIGERRIAFTFPKL